MPSYFAITYAVAAVLAIVLAMVGFSPGFIDYGEGHYGIFVGLLSYAWFLSLSLMLTLLIPRFRRDIVERLGKKLIFTQVAITFPFILWGAMMIVILVSQHG